VQGFVNGRGETKRNVIYSKRNYNTKYGLPKGSEEYLERNTKMLGIDEKSDKET